MLLSGTVVNHNHIYHFDQQQDLPGLISDEYETCSPRYTIHNNEDEINYPVSPDPPLGATPRAPAVSLQEMDSEEPQINWRGVSLLVELIWLFQQQRLNVIPHSIPVRGSSSLADKGRDLVCFRSPNCFHRISSSFVRKVKLLQFVWN